MVTDARDGRRGRAALLAVLCASWASAATPGGEAPAASAAIDGGANDDGANDDGAHDDEGAPGRGTVVFGHRDRSEPSADPAAASSVVTLDRAPRSGETVADLLAELPGVAINRLGSARWR